MAAVGEPREAVAERLVEELAVGVVEEDVVPGMDHADGLVLAEGLRDGAEAGLGGELIELINPRIVAYAGEQREQEGCLSIPDRWGITVRPAHVTVRATNRQGEEFTVTGSGLLARALCHEIDHLDGKLFVDKVIKYTD